MSRKEKMARLAKETLQIIEQGYYMTDKGKKIEIANDVAKCIQNTVSYSPNDFTPYFLSLKGKPKQNNTKKTATPAATAAPTESSSQQLSLDSLSLKENSEKKKEKEKDISENEKEKEKEKEKEEEKEKEKEVDTVKPTVKETLFTFALQTTLEGAEEMIQVKKYPHVAALNFASAKNPGGGFINGAGAQEESLARSSALYPSLISKGEMYEINKADKTCTYYHYMIYSPDVPFFRNDNGNLKNQPYLLSIITAPAVNAGIVRTRIQNPEPHIETVMRERIDRILSLAATHGHRHIILGAYGCGVFKNDPKFVVATFYYYLTYKYKNVFEVVHFACTDEAILRLFRSTFNR